MKELSKSDKKLIDKLYRKDKWPIKLIAKELHISDRRISAYLRGECCNEKPVPPKQKKEEDFTAKMEKRLAKLVNELGKQADEACTDFIAELHKVMLDVINELMECKKFNKKVWNKRLNDMRTKFSYSISANAVAMLFAMPKAYKRAFMEFIGIENPHYRDYSKSKK